MMAILGNGMKKSFFYSTLYAPSLKATPHFAGLRICMALKLSYKEAINHLPSIKDIPICKLLLFPLLFGEELKRLTENNYFFCRRVFIVDRHLNSKVSQRDI